MWPSACRHNPLNIFAAHEITGFADPSVATKMTVHFNLFGGLFSNTLHPTTCIHHLAYWSNNDACTSWGCVVSSLV